MTDGPKADLEDDPDADRADPAAGSGYALAPSGLIALGAVVFALSLALGTVTIAPSKSAPPAVRSAVTLADGALVGAPVLDAAVALPELAPADPPAVRRRARWKRAADGAARARRAALERADRAVALAAPAPAPAPVPVAAPAPAPVAPAPVSTTPPAVPRPGPNYRAAPAPAPAESESPAPTFDDGGVPDSGEFDYGDSP